MCISWHTPLANVNINHLANEYYEGKITNFGGIAHTVALLFCLSCGSPLSHCGSRLSHYGYPLFITLWVSDSLLLLFHCGRLARVSKSVLLCSHCVRLARVSGFVNARTVG